MPANIAHMLIAHEALKRLKADGDEGVKEFGEMLDDTGTGNYRAYMNLGSLGPDLYYYVDIGRSLQDILVDRYMEAKAITRWSYHLHSSQPNVFPLRLMEILFTDVDRKDGKVEDLKDGDKSKLTYIAGHLTHIAADQIIHPLVNKIAGPYYAEGKNRGKHRECEVFQDYFLYNKIYEDKIERDPGYGFFEQKFHEWVDCVKNVKELEEWVRYIKREKLRIKWNIRKALRFLKVAKMKNTRDWFRYFLQRGFAETYSIYPSEEAIEDSVDNLLLVLWTCRRAGPYKKVAKEYEEDAEKRAEYLKYIKDDEKGIDYMERYEEAVELSVVYLKALYEVYLVLNKAGDFNEHCKERFLRIVSDADLSCPLKRGMPVG
ncbi:MAG: zinc dependent phospholipase C family protein [Planctomycetota bacterium]|nr:MAG: zinc dependent phospholipase C family protein [Planctomycetota bacterium]